MKRINISVLSLILLIVCSCKKQNDTITTDLYATPEQSRGLVKTMSFKNISGTPVTYTYYYNTELKIKKIEIRQNGEAKFNLIYNYFSDHILRFITDPIGNNSTFSDSLFISQTGFISRWAQYTRQTNGSYLQLYCHRFEYDNEGYVSKAYYNWETSCNDTSVKPIIYQINNGNTISAIDFQPNFLPPIFYYFSYTHYNDKINKLENSYFGSAYLGKTCKNPIKEHIIKDTLETIIKKEEYSYEFNVEGFIVKKILDQKDTTIISYY